MITKAQGKACLDMAIEIAAGRASYPHTQGAKRALLHMGWMSLDAEFFESRFDTVEGPLGGFGPLDKHQMAVALSFAAAVAGVQP